MTGARKTFEIEGVKHSLYFGMVATEIILAKSVKYAESKDPHGIKSTAEIIYGGLCNNADLSDIDRPTFEEAYLIAESIISDEQLIKDILSAWTESKPYVSLMERLNGDKKKAETPEVEKNSQPKTGVK